MAVHPLIANRWSARSYDPTVTISAAQLTAIVEAARWAPTWGGTQPVRFFVGHRGDTTFERIAATLNNGNAWARNSAALVLLTTVATPDDPKRETYADVDLGLATANLILQANEEGFNAHPMAGFSASEAVSALNIPASERPLVVVAIGALAAADRDPETAARDAKPRSRKELSEIAFVEEWGRPWQPS